MRFSKTSPIVTALLLPVLCYALPQTRTLYDVEYGSTSGVLPSISASFVSTNAAGATVWAVEEVISVVEINGGSTTFTSDIPVTTVIGTAIEDAKTFLFSYIPENTLNSDGLPAAVQSCDISGSDGSCVDKAWIGTETATLTYTGTVVPIYTQTQAAGAAATSGTGTENPKAAATTTAATGSSKSGAATNQVATMAVIMGVIGCILTL